jgi:hypothetical protein
MEPRLVALDLFLDALGMGADKPADDRKRVQKAVYLGQVAGIDLGYRFGWYVMGPYSTSLARDYHALAKGSNGKRFQLASGARRVLARLAPLLEKPNAVENTEQWLGLLASYHYLVNVRGLSEEDAHRLLEEERPDLAAHTDLAAASLREYRLLPQHEVREASR